jgi:hypothetical protein
VDSGEMTVIGARDGARVGLLVGRRVMGLLEGPRLNGLLLGLLVGFNVVKFMWLVLLELVSFWAWVPLSDRVWVSE